MSTSLRWYDKSGRCKMVGSAHPTIFVDVIRDAVLFKCEGRIDNGFELIVAGGEYGKVAARHFNHFGVQSAIQQQVDRIAAICETDEVIRP